jgi:hypothetical protein
MFDRTFFHIDEYGSFGPRALAPILCVSERTVLWAPAPLLVERAEISGESVIGTTQLLELIEERFAVVIAREQWFDRKWRNRDGAWDLIRWRDPFDSKLLSWAKEDESKPLAIRRVIVAEAESGFDKARAALEADPRLSAQLITLYNQNRLPEGVLEKAQRAQGAGKPVELQILRDAFNHHSAVLESGCQTATVPDSFMPTLLALADETEEPNNISSTSNDSNAQAFAEAIDLLLSIQAPKSSDALLLFLRSRNRTQLIELLGSKRLGTLADNVVIEIEKATQINSFWSNLFPDKAVDKNAATIGGILGAILSAVVSSGGVWLATTPLKLLRPWLQRHSQIALDLTGNSAVPPLIQLALETSRPTNKQIQDLLTKLRRY